jgi:hypothetical protein
MMKVSPVWLVKEYWEGRWCIRELKKNNYIMTCCGTLYNLASGDTEVKKFHYSITNLCKECVEYYWRGEGRNTMIKSVTKLFVSLESRKNKKRRKKKTA